MGIGASHQTKLEREFGDVGDGDGEERFFGLENFGNTCYCNSVLQALYFCEPLRHRLAELREEDAQSDNWVDGGTGGRGGSGGVGGGGKSSGEKKENNNSVIVQLAELFALISRQKRRSGFLAPTDFLRTLRERNELFRGNMQQDAHEFFNFVLNEMADSLVTRNKRTQQQQEAVALEQQGKRSQNQNPNLQVPQQHNNHGSQQYHPPDPRRSPWSKKMGLKAGFGNGVRSAPPAAGAETVAAASTAAGGLGGGTSHKADQNSGGDGVGGNTGGERSAPSSEDALGPKNQRAVGGAGCGEGSSTKPSSTAASNETWVHRIFQGVLTNQTKCLCCETVSNRDEPFMDLSLDVEQNSSVTACLRSFSSTETLTKKNKFFCENCNALQEAEKKIRLKRLPRVLTLHLKRFKYVESLDTFSKLSHRVVFPLELRAPNMTEGQGEADADGRLYRLFAVVVHIGRGPNHGHYVAVVKSGGRWLLFDDDIVELVDEQVLKQCFGLSRPAAAATNTGYLLLYDCGVESGEGVVSARA